jgi:hypothetical protein
MEPEDLLPCSREPSMAPTLSQMNPVRIFTPYSFKKLKGKAIPVTDRGGP